MRVGGLFFTARRKDRVLSSHPPGSMRPLAPKGGPLDVRVSQTGRGGRPVLLVGSPRGSGSAVERNRFRRRVRLAFLEALRARGGDGVCRGSAFLVRPARGCADACRTDFPGISDAIELAFSRLGPT